MNQTISVRTVRASVFSKQIGRYTPSVPTAVSYVIRLFLEEANTCVQSLLDVENPYAFKENLHFNAALFLWYCRYAYYPSDPLCDITVLVPEDFRADNLDAYENITTGSCSTFC